MSRIASADELYTHYFRQGWHIDDLRAKRSVPLVLSGASVVIDQDIVTGEEMRSDAYYNECIKAMAFE